MAICCCFSFVSDYIWDFYSTEELKFVCITRSIEARLALRTVMKLVQGDIRCLETIHVCPPGRACWSDKTASRVKKVTQLFSVPTRPWSRGSNMAGSGSMCQGYDQIKGSEEVLRHERQGCATAPRQLASSRQLSAGLRDQPGFWSDAIDPRCDMRSDLGSYIQPGSDVHLICHLLKLGTEEVVTPFWSRAVCIWDPLYLKTRVRVFLRFCLPGSNCVPIPEKANKQPPAGAETSRSSKQ